MDTIEFRIEHRDLGVGPSDCVEITINGKDLGDWGAGYAGLSPAVALAPSTRFLDEPTAAAHSNDGAYEHPDDDGRRRAYIMRCVCGDSRCSYVLAKIRVDSNRVTWTDIFGSHSDPRVYGELGPFEFDRAAYQQSLRRLR